MSDQPASTPSAQSGPGWWSSPRLLRGLLIASLALNLLVVSAVATRVIRGERAERLPGSSQVQLLPRRFIRDLPADKRRATRDILRRFAQEQRGDREWVRTVSLKLADAITAEPYDVERVRAVLSEYASRSGAAASRSGVAALEILALLTPEERAGLAEAIRSRAAPRR